MFLIARRQLLLLLVTTDAGRRGGGRRRVDAMLRGGHPGGWRIGGRGGALSSGAGLRAIKAKGRGLC
jgi:hypothetical protein